MDKTWVFPDPPLPGAADALAGYTPIQRRILLARGLHTAAQAEDFLRGDTAGEGDPEAILGMEDAVARLASAVEAGEPIVVYGDYDADGVTATALLVGCLDQVGARVTAYIPDRFDEGYGLNGEALRSLRTGGAQVVVTVDCGIRSLEEVRIANELGLEVIVTDHHQPGTRLPDALAVVNPGRPGDSYPYRGLTGVGLAYKLSRALTRHLGAEPPERVLQLVAVGTVADMAPLDGENRYLVSEGLRQLNHDASVGLRALARIAGYPHGAITASAIGFGLAPRLNAAGRLDSADLALRLLLESDLAAAEDLAGKLNGLNRQRQQITDRIVERARQTILQEGLQGELAFAAGEDFNEGVVGLAASRLMQEFYRPAIVASLGDEHTRASARSIPEFDITRALDRCADLLVRYGGHAGAAGFTVRTEQLPELLARLREEAGKKLGAADLKPALQVDARVEFAELDESLLEFLDRLEPCGMGNPTPLFAASGARLLSRRAVGAGGSHLKLTVEQGGRVFDAIAFRQGARAASLPGAVDLAFHFERNTYQGIVSMQLNVVDLRPAS